MISLLYPTDAFNSKVLDESFQEEAQALSQFFKIHTINVDDIEHSRISPNLEEGEKLIYRGWMLQAPQYEQLYKKTNQQLLISPQEYLSSHHFPNWYHELHSYTPESVICHPHTAIQTYQQFGRTKVFIKDYVKSLKTGRGSIASSTQEVAETIEQMQHYRGFIEGGIVIREAHDFIASTEQRFFVLNKQVFYSGETSEEKLKLVNEVKEKVQSTRQFFSLDVIEDSHNKLWLVEIGDGQVSDLVNWKMDDFVKMFHSTFNIQKKPKP